MDTMKGLTINEMAEKLGISPNAVKQRLFQRGIKPICKDALYAMTALKEISDFGPKGFQPKEKTPQKATKKSNVKEAPKPKRGKK
jgi:transcriptional regulator with XRE-family HTH domain